VSAVKAGPWRWLAACLAVAVLAGCGSTRLVYGQLDLLLPWYFRDYVDLETGQRQQLERSVDLLLTWHRESQVGRYAEFFRELADEAASPLGYERIDAARRMLDGFWDDIVRQVTPEAAGLLATLDESQVEEMFRRIAEKDAEEAAEARARSEAERLGRREKMLRRQAERWVGRLDEAQRAIVADCAAGLYGDVEGWLASRRRWQQAFREAMAVRGDRALFEPRLERLFADGESFWEEDYRRHFVADRERVLRMMADLDASLDARQRAHLRERLERWALDFEAIAGGA
jgi:hypothetical protein